MDEPGTVVPRVRRTGVWLETAGKPDANGEDELSGGEQHCASDQTAGRAAVDRGGVREKGV
jgi:hypothetical protein